MPNESTTTIIRCSRRFFPTISIAAILLATVSCGDSGEKMNGRNARNEAGASPATESRDGYFPVFSALLYENRPRPTGDDVVLDKLRMAYDVSLFSDRKDKDEPDLERVRKTAFRFQDHIPVCLDIEHWHVNGNDEQANASIDKLIAVIEAVREEKPNVKLGYYSVLPHHSYWAAVKADDSSDSIKWKKVNKRLRRLAAEVDYIFPSLYTFYEDQDRWEKSAIEHIQEARQYGKPVYVFLWPQYHQGGSFKTPPTPFIDRAYWRRQLEVCYEHADGIVLWGGWDLKAWEKMTWDPEAEWWRETEDFIRKIRAEEVKRGIKTP